MKKTAIFAVAFLILTGCSQDPVETIKTYRHNYKIELQGYNVDKDEDGNEVAINIELSVDNNNRGPALSYITLVAKQYDANDKLLSEDLISLPLKGIPGYKHRVLRYKLKKVMPGFMSLSVYKAQANDPAKFMDYIEFKKLKKE
jgi:hypothetical protein